VQLLKDLFLVGSGRSGFGISDDYDCHVYLLDGGEEAALIDAGAGVNLEPLLANVSAHCIELSRVRKVILTHGHPDHGGGSAELRSRLGCQVMVGEAEAGIVESGDPVASGLQAAMPSGIYPAGYRLAPCPVDRRLRHGDMIEVGKYTLETIATPGHSPGSICFLFTIEGRRALFSGDTVQFCPVASQTGWISLLNCPGTDLGAYRESVRSLSGLAVDALLPGHRVFTLQYGQRVIDSVVRGFESLSIPRSVM
jgi:glyoxylase-like metal-dependent hydrolase (beta-lactamase superfamily II)